MCGVAGIVGEQPVAARLCQSIHALQHRGQDAAGIATLHQGVPHIRKGLGLVSQVFADGAPDFPGTLGVAHTRYPTWGAKTADEAQPYANHYPPLLLAHNGNLVGEDTSSRSDSEIILLRLAQAFTEHSDALEAVRALVSSLEGSYAVVAAILVDGVETLVGLRDPNAIRPLVFGSRGDEWMLASESVALDALGFKLEGHVPGGNVVFLQAGQKPRLMASTVLRPTRRCVFERVYLARPDSRMEDGRVMSTRGRLGIQLAKEWSRPVDVVVPVPDTSRPAATAMAEHLKLPVREGFIKNRYSHRTFIMPDQASRELAIRLKLNTVREAFEGRRVLLLDDSIVRGTTMKQIVNLVWQCDPLEVHVGVLSPPVMHPCRYGINMATYEELIAAGRPSSSLGEELATEFGATSLQFLSVRGLYKVGGPDICAACFDGKYPVG